MIGFNTSRLPSTRTLLMIVTVSLLLVLGGSLAAGWYGVLTIAIAAAVAVSLLLDVELPWGGAIPLGHALVIALVELISREQFATVVALGLLAAYPLTRARHSGTRAKLLLTATALSAVAAQGAFWTAQAFIEPLVATQSDPSSAVVLSRVLIAGSAYLLVDFILRGRLLSDRDQPISVKEMLPIGATLLCAAALLAIAQRKLGFSAGLVAGVPLLVTRYSFQRYAAARLTYAQTTQALAMLPEIAGLSPLGHGERTSVYAAALAAELGYTLPKVDRVRTAARLHHIGHISLSDYEGQDFLPEAAELATVSEEILRETGFLAPLAGLVAEVQVASPATVSEEAAIVRVASTFDDLVGEAMERASWGTVQLQAKHPVGLERRLAIEFARLVDREPDLVEFARQAGAPLTAAAAQTAAASS